MDAIVTPGELCGMLGIEYYQFRYLLRVGRIPPPRKSLLGRRRFYTLEDMRKIQEALRKRPAQGEEEPA